MERFYPLHVYVCEKCFLVQLQEYVAPEEIFTEYAYFSSYSETWLQHAKTYTDMAVERFKFDGQSYVIEIASNDGYLLQYFLAKGIGALGIEPAANVAKVAADKGIPTVVKFFGQQLAEELISTNKHAELIIANNVLAQVPDINDFVAGIKILLASSGVVTIEFPHLMALIEGSQLDTIYHEHFSYFSFSTMEKILAAHELTIFDVEELATHGGSLRIFARHAADESKPITGRVGRIRNLELAAGYNQIRVYSSFSEKAKEAKRKLLEFLIACKRDGKSIAAYGAPGKGNTLLNYCGIRSDFIEYTVDRNPYKQGKFLPGTHIPIFNPTHILETRPDFIVILPWNLRGEIMEQLAYIREWGGCFVVPIPEVKVYP